MHEAKWRFSRSYRDLYKTLFTAAGTVAGLHGIPFSSRGD